MVEPSSSYRSKSKKKRQNNKCMFISTIRMLNGNPVNDLLLFVKSVTHPREGNYDFLRQICLVNFTSFKIDSSLKKENAEKNRGEGMNGGCIRQTHLHPHAAALHHLDASGCFSFSFFF